MSAKNRWQQGGGKALTAARACNSLTQNQGVSDEQFHRAKITFFGLFIIMVSVWSTVLISSIFALRVNWNNCESCPDGCECRGAPPAWG